MFKVRNSKWKVFTVYGVKKLKYIPKGQTVSRTEFLIYTYEWKWVNAEEYQPYEENSANE